MLKRIAFMLLLTFAFATLAAAQTPNMPATRKRTATPTPTPTPEKQVGKSAKTPAAGGGGTVLDTFNALLDGIRAADVKVVTGIYWNSPQLLLFNNNGTVTKGWEQMRKNRESSYPELKNVALEVRDVHVTMLGRDAALVTCLWTQSQTFRGADETASGRMTIVFRHLGNAWKAIHLHTSPDAPDPSRVLPSEQTSPEPKSTT
ncbi:MAG: nuclear transport factor 2 family protein [Acidobacteria bacterium]|nr:nuclear transport factor 2 family protein [Acidobacteriota bacterium]